MDYFIRAKRIKFLTRCNFQIFNRLSLSSKSMTLRYAYAFVYLNSFAHRPLPHLKTHIKGEAPDISRSVQSSQYNFKEAWK